MLAVAGLVAVAGVRAWGTTRESIGPLAGGLALALDLTALAALVLGYLALAVPRASGAGSLRALSVPLGAAVAVLGLTVAAGMLDRGAIDPKTALPTSLATAWWAGVVGLAEAGLAAVVLASLRPLVLHRRRQATVWVWAALLVLGVAAGLAVAGRPLTSYPPAAMVPFLVGTVVVGTGLALRQRWTGALTSGQRLGAAGLALALAGALIGLLYVQSAGPAVLVIGDGTGEVDSVTYAAVLSRALGATTTLALAWGCLYSLTAALVLLLGLPSADRQDQRAGERRALRSLADLSGRLLDRVALAEAVARGPVESGLADAAWVALTDPAHGVLTPVVTAAQGVGLETAVGAADIEALYRAAVAQDRPLVLGRAEADHRVRARPGDGVASLVALPLGSRGPGPGGVTRGVLVVTRATAEAFEPDDLAALDTFAGQAALSLSHADLFADALERDRLARELALAREVQQRLLPQSIPQLDGLEVAAAERPAREVGGDYYDAVRLGDDCLGLIVADVSGKGAPAAFYMAELKGVFQAGSRLTRAPGELLAGANDALSPSLGRGVFVSAVYAVVDARAGTLALARAGHTPAVLVRDRARPDGGRWLLRSDGLALGLDRRGDLFRQTLVEQTVRLAPGDTLVLYTDGLVEARSEAGEEYGYDRLAAFVEAQRGADAETLRDRLLAEHAAWAHRDEPDDDTTFVVVRWTGRGADASAGTDRAESDRAEATDRPPTAPASGPPVAERPAFPNA